jgi:hypothetical protein
VHVCMSVCMYTCMVLRCPLESCARVALWIVMEVAVFEGSFVRMHAYMCVCVCMYVTGIVCMCVTAISTGIFHSCGIVLV